MSGGFIPSSASEMPPTPPSQPVNEELTPLQADEQALEHLKEVEVQEEFLEKEEVVTAPVIQVPTPQAVATSSSAPAAKKDEALLEVEKILEEGLGDFVTSLPEAPKARFLALGREIAAKIARMVRGYKVKVRDVVHLIREWLLVIPGVNAFFLEQEAKIKTDRILDYEQRYHDTHVATP